MSGGKPDATRGLDLWLFIFSMSVALGAAAVNTMIAGDIAGSALLSAAGMLGAGSRNEIVKMINRSRGRGEP